MEPIEFMRATTEAWELGAIIAKEVWNKRKTSAGGKEGYLARRPERQVYRYWEMVPGDQ